MSAFSSNVNRLPSAATPRNGRTIRAVRTLVCVYISHISLGSCKWVNVQSKYSAVLFLICVATMLIYPLVEAKPSIDLDFEKNNGYGAGNDIGGLWTITAHVSSDVQYVEFYLDDQLQKNDTASPFNWQFDTTNYTPGSHAIKAVAYDALGDSAFLQVERNFEETSTGTVTVTIIAIAVAIVVAAIAFALRKTRKQ